MHFMELASEAPRLDCHHRSHAAVNRWRRDGFSVQREFTAEPDKTETFIVSKAKHYLVRRASRVGIPPPLTEMQASITEGDKLFGTECSECHGDNGRRPTDAGRWMYPRAADLGSVEVQNYSDRELFWIVKNGIRLSGMPAFGQVL
jgi:hypothetical protein